MTEVFPGSLAAFQSVNAGANSITVDPADFGIGLQGFTVVSVRMASFTAPYTP